MTITAAEQYAIELVNRARLDPLAEAKRYGINLNEGLSAGSISTEAKQVVAPHEALADAAEDHSQWIIDTDTFSHTGANGSTAGERMQDAGYPGFGGGSGWGENLSLLSVESYTETELADRHHAQLMRSNSHRPTIMGEEYRELGIGIVEGVYSARGTSYDVTVQTENYAYRNSVAYVTGVAYDDADGDGFYSIGEGMAGVQMSLQGGASTTTAAPGGYALDGVAGTEVRVAISNGNKNTTLDVDLSDGNVKVDLVNGNLLKVSGDVSLVKGPVRNVTALGIDDIDLAGNAANNRLFGNKGDNELNGGGRNDALKGGAGNDKLIGGRGHDNLDGGNGRDVMQGGAGKDMLAGGRGIDKMAGGAGADTFVFGKGFGRDRVNDFKMAQNDKLQFDDALWSGDLTEQQVVDQFAEVVNGNVVFDFGAGLVTLAGLSSTAGLADHIDII